MDDYRKHRDEQVGIQVYLYARGEHHYLVYKEDTEVRTETHIRALTPKEHEDEIEKMCSL